MHGNHRRARPVYVCMRLLGPAIAVAFLAVSGCSSDDAAAPEPERAGASAASTASRQTSSAASMPLGHCWIDPVRFDGSVWAVAANDQFGSGGGMPNSWVGEGTLTRVSSDESEYKDEGGTILRLVPADRPAAAAVFEQGCD